MEDQVSFQQLRIKKLLLQEKEIDIQPFNKEEYIAMR